MKSEREIDIYIYIDGSDLQDVEDGISESINHWLGETKFQAKLINYRYPRTPDLEPDDLEDWNLGVNVKLNSATQLKVIAEYLYLLAKQFKRDFVVGYVENDSGVTEDITFFGYECGKPKIQEICKFLDINC